MNANVATFRALNNAGVGFDPEGEMDEWTLVSAAETTDDVSVYTDEDGATVLVGTDGSGSDDSRWAVRVPPTPEPAITDDQIEALCIAAGEAQDWVQVALCDTALGRVTAALDALYDSKWSEVTQDEARAECARVIEAARDEAGLIVGRWLVSSEGGPDIGQVVEVEGQRVVVAWSAGDTVTHEAGPLARVVESFQRHSDAVRAHAELAR